MDVGRFASRDELDAARQEQDEAREELVADLCRARQAARPDRSPQFARDNVNLRTLYNLIQGAGQELGSSRELTDANLERLRMIAVHQILADCARPLARQRNDSNLHWQIEEMIGDELDDYERWYGDDDDDPPYIPEEAWQESFEDWQSFRDFLIS